MGTVVSRGYLVPRAVDGVRGCVRATFGRCAYVAVEGGPLLVLHAAGGGDHTPTSLCPSSWQPAAVEVGDPVVGRAGHMKIGELVLNVGGARVWRPAAPVHPARLAFDAIDAHHRAALQAASQRTGGLLPALEHALARRDAGRVTDCVASLVGRGPGLTPSGDDALVGLLAVLHRLAPAAEPSHVPGPATAEHLDPGEAPLAPLGPAVAEHLDRGEGPLAPLGPAVAEHLDRGEGPLALLGPAVVAHLDRTADISAHHLRLAVAGHVGERLIALCDALAAGAHGEVEATSAAVVATGATSGADALLGVVSGVRLVVATRTARTAVAA